MSSPLSFKRRVVSLLSRLFASHDVPLRPGSRGTGTAVFVARWLFPGPYPRMGVLQLTCADHFPSQPSPAPSEQHMLATQTQEWLITGERCELSSTKFLATTSSSIRATAPLRQPVKNLCQTHILVSHRAGSRKTLECGCDIFSLIALPHDPNGELYSYFTK